MNKAEANEKAKQVFEEWAKKKAEIAKKAKEDGTWNEYGLDSNNHLFKDIDKEAKERLKSIKEQINN